MYVMKYLYSFLNNFQFEERVKQQSINDTYQSYYKSVIFVTNMFKFPQNNSLTLISLHIFTAKKL